MADKIQELIDKRAQLWNAAKTFLDERTDKDGKLSAEDAATYDKMEADVVAYGKDIERLERQRRLEAELAKPATDAIVNAPVADNGATQEKKTGRASDEYKKAMLDAIRTDFRHVSNVMSEGVAADGGYLVPDEWDRRLIEGIEEQNIMRRFGTNITTSGLHKINIAGTKPAAAWIDEGDSINFSDATFSQISLDAHKLLVAVKVTNELLSDNAFGLESYILTQFAQAIANAEEDAFLNGPLSTPSGSAGKPKGLFTTAAAQLTATAETAGNIETNNISADDIVSLVYSLKRPYRRRAVFIMNDSVIASIRKLKDENKLYMWQPSYQADEPDRLLGYPVYTSTYAPAIAPGAAVIAFGDMSYYNIGDRGTRTIQELRELYAGNDMTGYVMKERVDGVLVLPEAVRVLKIAS